MPAAIIPDLIVLLNLMQSPCFVKGVFRNQESPGLFQTQETQTNNTENGFAHVEFLNSLFACWVSTCSVEIL
jgi:hypothetical protein